MILITSELSHKVSNDNGAVANFNILLIVLLMIQKIAQRMINTIILLYADVLIIWSHS